MEELSSPDASPSHRRLSTASSSPSSDFEFCPLPDPDLPSADELFSQGVLLPLHQRQNPPPPPPPPPSPPPESATPTTSTLISSDPPHLVTSRWKDLFKKQPRERKLAPELNINLWPFSRSRSASNQLTTPAASQRKTSSAPCSRSNSRSRWASSPSRSAGIHVGRTSPVWRRGPKKGGEVKGGAGVGMLNRKVDACIGYGGGPARCGGEHKDGVTGGDRSARVAYFGLKSLFFSNKKVY